MGDLERDLERDEFEICEDCEDVDDDVVDVKRGLL